MYKLFIDLQSSEFDSPFKEKLNKLCGRISFGLKKYI